MVIIDCGASTDPPRMDPAGRHTMDVPKTQQARILVKREEETKRKYRTEHNTSLD